MNTDVSARSKQSNGSEMSFRLIGRHVDDEVAKGRNLNDILTLEQGKPSGKYWFNKEALYQYSEEVAKSFQEAR